MQAIDRSAGTTSSVRVALIGYGLAGATFHAPFIRAVERLQLTTVVTSRTQAVAHDLPGVQIYAVPDEAFADPNIDLVVIATPNQTHEVLAQRALLAGKHVVIDKPMTTTVAAADSLIALATERGRLLSVYQNRRWDGAFLTLAQTIAAGRLGHVYLYEAHYDRFRPQIKPGWREQTGLGSGVLFDLGSHLIDQALTLFGLPQTIAAEVLVQRPHALVDDYFALWLGYADRRVILRASTLVREPGPLFAVHGDAGSFIKYGSDPQETALKAGIAPNTPGFGAETPDLFGTLIAADGTRETIPTQPGAYSGFYAGMAAAILDGADVPVAPSAARNVIALIELARRSAHDGATLAVSV